MPTLAWSVLSERGLRPQNDDGTPTARIGKYTALILADGLSDSAHTDTVNSVALDAIGNTLKNIDALPRPMLDAGVRAADVKVKDLLRQYRDSEPYATKLLPCLIDDNLQCTVLDTGNGNCHLITDDAVPNARAAAELNRGPGGVPLWEETEKPSRADMISHVLGAPCRLRETDFCEFPLGDAYLLLSSDGLTGYLGERGIADTVRTRGDDGPDAATEALVQEALKAGSTDAITVILARRTPS